MKKQLVDKMCLKFWKRNKNNFPGTSSSAGCVLYISATCASCQKFFSLSGRVCKVHVIKAELVSVRKPELCSRFEHIE